MDFARKQLEKYGWIDGKGLGKNENGISEALKPKLKRSVAGLGHDAAADFTEHWWTELYNKAAKNVEVLEKNGVTKKIKTTDQEGFEITNSTWKMNRKRKQKDDNEGYSDYFVKKAVLANGGSKLEKTVDSDSEEESTKKDVFKMTDEELFAACEGRTAHKGARHGLKATGKLARIAQQEEILLRQTRYNGYSHTKNISNQEDVSESDLLVVEDLNLTDETNSFKKRKKKKRKRCVSQTNEISLEASLEPVKYGNEMSEKVNDLDINYGNCIEIKKTKSVKLNDKEDKLSITKCKEQAMPLNISPEKDKSKDTSSEMILMKCKKKKKKKNK
ncbi:hypothetical protein ACJJTC_017434 [Scirpophaga incertulas]